MKVLSREVIPQLILLESEIHYSELPPPEVQSYIAIERNSPVLLSAPHGAKTFRNNNNEKWHEEEYTAGMALLLSELCRTSVIATTWRSEHSDPNEHSETKSSYKQAIRSMVGHGNIKWLIDLHGAGQGSKNLAKRQLVDLGIGTKSDYLPEDVYRKLVTLIEKYQDEDVTKRREKYGFPASGKNRIAAFAYKQLETYSVQIEMKPSVRVPHRRVDASMYGKALAEGGGPYSASPHMVLDMLQALVDFIESLRTLNV